MNIEYILECIRKTNPGMTMDRMIEELCKCSYSAFSLAMICEEEKKYACGEQYFYCFINPFVV